MTDPTPPEYPPPPPANPAYPPPPPAPPPPGAPQYPPPGASQYPPPAAPQYPAPQYPQAPGGYYQQPGYGGQMPSQNWGWSIVGILFFLFSGIVAVYFSSQVKTLWNRGDVAGSTRASKMARTWGIVSIVLGVIAGVYLASQGGSSTS